MARSIAAGRSSARRLPPRKQVVGKRHRDGIGESGGPRRRGRLLLQRRRAEDRRSRSSAASDKRDQRAVHARSPRAKSASPPARSGKARKIPSCRRGAASNGYRAGSSGAVSARARFHLLAFVAQPPAAAERMLEQDERRLAATEAVPVIDIARATVITGAGEHGVQTVAALRK